MLPRSTGNDGDGDLQAGGILVARAGLLMKQNRYTTKGYLNRVKIKE